MAQPWEKPIKKMCFDGMPLVHLALNQGIDGLVRRAASRLVFAREHAIRPQVVPGAYDIQPL